MGARDHSQLILYLRRRAASVLWAEQILHAFTPAAGLVLAYLVIALAGVANPTTFLIFTLAAAAALVYGLAGLRRPPRQKIDRRIEAASNLAHRPLAMLADQPANMDPAALALWQIHQQRLASSLSAARAGAPRPHLAARDPLALRILLALLLLTGLIIAGPAAPSRLAAAFVLPHRPFTGPRIDAWIIPPDYAAAPPHLLNPGENVTALAGSRLTLLINGPREAPKIRLAGTNFISTALSRTSHRDDAVLNTSGRLRAGPWWHRLAVWTITVTPPGAPAITLGRLAITQTNHLMLRWHIDDPYGIASVTIAFHPAGHRHALPLRFPVPANAGAGGVTLDLADSPFHNLPTGFTLQATNLAGVTSSFTYPNNLILPGLALHDRTSLAMNRLRQALAIEPETMPLIATQLRALAAAPPSAISPTADIETAILAETLRERQVSAQNSIGQMLSLIKQIEAGPDFAPAQALAAANQALQAALNRGLHGQRPSAAALQALLSAMHRALAAHLAAMSPVAGNPQGRSFDPSALDQLARKVAADEAAGRTAQAQQELQQLQAGLQALQSAQPMTARQAAQSQAAQQAAQGLSQLINAQAGMLDATNQGTATPNQQAGLQAELEAIRQQLAQAGIHLPSAANAARAMGDAHDALQQGNIGEAALAESTAIAALQQAAAALHAAGRNSISIGQGDQPIPGGDATGLGVNGTPDEDDAPGLDNPTPNQAGAVQDRIIQQNANPSLPAPTHQYLQRLLNPN